MNGDANSHGRVPSRRKFLSLAAAGTAAVAGISTASAQSGITEFNPSDFDGVDRFVNTIFPDSEDRDPYRKLQDKDFDGRERTLLESLDDLQAEAVLDAIRPSRLWSEREITYHRRSTRRPATSHPETAESTASRVEIKSIGNDPVQKWGWEIESRDDLLISDGSSTSLGLKNQNARVAAPDSAEYTNTVHSYAISLDWDGYKWRGEIYWDYDWSSGHVYNTAYNDTVLDTHYAVDHEGTDATEIDSSDKYRVNFQATFNNELPELCFPWGGPCIDLSEKFYPYMDLQGDSLGNGETLEEDDDSIL